MPSFYIILVHDNWSGPAPLLGAFSVKGTIETANYDMNDLPYGMYTIGFGARQTLVNSPFVNAVFSVLHFTMLGDYLIKNSSIQIAYREEGVKVRVRWTDNWTAWKDLITSWT